MAVVATLIENLLGRFQRDFSDAGGWTNPPRTDDFDRLVADSLPHEWTKRFNELGDRLARGYYGGEYAFWFCDRVMSAAHGKVIDLRVAHDAFEHPDFFEEVYEAFDDGEWDHHGKSKDPIVEYTNPAIEKIVSRLGLTPAP